MTINRSLLLVIPTLLLAQLSGCAARDGAAPPASSSQSVVVVEKDAYGVAVTGRGEVVVTPDTAFVDVGIETHGPTVAAARAAGAKAMNALIESVTKNGVQKPDIQTSQLSIAPRYDYDRPTAGVPRITGYTMTTSVAVRVRDLDRVSAVVDDAARAAGDAARVSGIRFTVEDAAAVRDQARASAIREARKKAEQIATVSGSKLGNLVGIEEVAVQLPPMPMLTLEGGDVSTRTPIERGSATVVVEVRARWAIAG